MANSGVLPGGLFRYQHTVLAGRMMVEWKLMYVLLKVVIQYQLPPSACIGEGDSVSPKYARKSVKKWYVAMSHILSNTAISDMANGTALMINT